MDNGYVGTEEEWLESLHAQPEPFRSCYYEVLGSAQTVANDTNVVFDIDTEESVGNYVTLNAGGTVFTITRTGLYLVNWTLDLAEDTQNAVLGIAENGLVSSGSSSTTGGSMTSGALIHVDTVPYQIALHNFADALTLVDGVGFAGTAASFRIARFADEPLT